MLYEVITSAIGDCVHAVALVQAIQRQWPATRITWIMGKLEARLLGDLPGVEVIAFDKGAGLAGYRAVWRQLKGRRVITSYSIHYTKLYDECWGGGCSTARDRAP